MKLFLSSMHPSNTKALLDLLGNPDRPSVVIIPTGWNTYPHERKVTELEHVLAIFNDLKFSSSVMDITGASKESIKEALTGKSLVWVMAGNTFYLTHFLHKSGFAEVIKGLMKHGLVYGGESAGAVAAGTTLRGVEKMDDPDESPETHWEGLSLIDYGILPHWEWEKYRAEIEAAKSEMDKFAQVITMTNDQAITVIDGKVTHIQNPSHEV